MIFPSSTPSPHMIAAPTLGSDLAGFVAARQSDMQANLLEHGALLFRGFGVNSLDDFQGFLAALGLPPMEYVYRSTPRSQVAKDVFTATEYPRQQEIPLHNENAYQRDWPLQLSFYCEAPATGGGQTSIADMRRVTSAIGEETLDAFARRGVRYTRHFRDHVDLSWSNVFQTDTREGVTDFCSRNGLREEWLADGTLRTSQECQGVARHPTTGEVFFFNQAHLFHPSSLGKAAAEALVQMFGADRLPRYASFGDGDDIPDKMLADVRTAFETNAVNVEWRRGDVLLLDNMRMAHGRRSFEGPRRVLTSLLNSHAAATA